MLWGFDGVVLTPKLFHLNVGFVVFLFHAIPFFIMNLFMFKEYKYLSKFTKNDLFFFMAIAIFGGALGTLAIVKALFLVNFNHLSVVVLLQKLQPIFAIILAGIILKEKISKKFAVWALVALLGSYFLTFGFGKPNLFGDNLLLASMWAIIAAFSFGSSTVFGKKILQKYSFHTANFYRFGFTTFLMLIFVLFTGKFSEFSNLTPFNWMIFLIIAFTTGSGAIFIYYYGLKEVKAIVSTMCELFFPLSAIIFDYLINKNILSIGQWIGAIILLGAIIRITVLQYSSKSV